MKKLKMFLTLNIKHNFLLSFSIPMIIFEIAIVESGNLGAKPFWLT